MLHTTTVVGLFDIGRLWLALHKPNNDQYPDFRHVPSPLGQAVCHRQKDKCQNLTDASALQTVNNRH